MKKKEIRKILEFVFLFSQGLILSTFLWIGVIEIKFIPVIKEQKNSISKLQRYIDHMQNQQNKNKPAMEQIVWIDL